MPPRTLLDTNTVWAYMRGEPIVAGRAEEYTNAHGKLNFSVFTRYEILRTLKAKGAVARLRAFTKLCAASNLFEVTDAIAEQAADLHIDLYGKGVTITDADALIAATALVHGMALATDDEERFSRIAGLQVESWLETSC